MLIKVLDCATGKYATAEGWTFDANNARTFASLAEAEAFCVDSGVHKAEAVIGRPGKPAFRISLAVRHTLYAARRGGVRQNSRTSRWAQ